MDDIDGDGWIDLEEFFVGIDVEQSDLDNDGVLDGDEYNWIWDGDCDGFIGGFDVDVDNDGIVDGFEVLINLLLVDSDGDN